MRSSAGGASASRHTGGLLLLAALVLMSGGAGCLEVLLWQGVAEVIEPHWTLQLYGLFSQSKDGVQVAVGPASSVLLYGETRPYAGEGAALQKGLVWIYDDQPLIGAGRGLGVPVVVANGQRYHARHASIYFDPTTVEFRLRKVFVMDAVETPMHLLQPRYRPVEAIGEVAVTYVVQSDGIIAVEVDCSGLTAPWEQVLILNEQGAQYLDRYEDDSGRSLRGHALRGWQMTTASTACLASTAAQVQFCVTPEPGGSLFYGREQGLLWNWRGAYRRSAAGIGILVAGPRDSYHYRIALGAVPAKVTPD